MLLVFPLEQLLRDALPHELPLLFVEKAEFRVDVDGREVFPDQPLAKSMQRGNRGVGKQDDLAGKLRAIFQFVRQLLFNALAHFRRRRVREGDDQKLVDPVFSGNDVSNDPLHQRVGLARAGRRRDEQVAAAFCHGAELSR